VFLLPGNPVSCLCAYEFFAGPTLRALGGRSRAWPHRRVSLPLARKISSAVGRTDYVRVAIEAGRVVPIATSGASILSSTVRADGCVIVPRALEGMPEGALVEVRLYDEHRDEWGERAQRSRRSGLRMRQQQFLEVRGRDEAERRWRAAIDARPLPAE